MKRFFRSSALFLALLTTLSFFAACNDNASTKENTPSDAVSSSQSQESLVESGSTPHSDAPVSPSAPKESESKNDEQLAVNTQNAAQKLKAGYMATMSASSLKLAGEVSSYAAAAGKGDTVVFPIAYTLNKGTDGAYTALLSYGGSNTTDLYYNGDVIYQKITEQDGSIEVSSTKSTQPLTIENTLMPLLNEDLSILSFDNVFDRFCQSEFGIDFADGIYTLYFYGSYTELCRIFLEDDAYESLLAKNLEESFPSNAGSVEFYLTESGFFAGMKTGTELTSEKESMKASLSYTFSDFNADLSFDAPAWISEAK